VTPTTLGGLHGSRTVGTTSFEVLVSPPSLGLAAQAIGCRSLLSSTPSGTGAEVEALVDRSSATAFFARVSKWFCDTSTGAAIGASRCGFFVGGGFSLLVASYG
jgi:hypothetical protein